MTRLLVFGDSNAWGMYDLEKQGWVNRLREYFENNNIDISVYNCAISAENTNGALKRLESEIDSRKGSGEIILMFAYGNNDCTFMKHLNSRQVEFENFKNNIQRMCDIAKSRAVKTFFISTLLIDESKLLPASFDPNFFTYEEDINRYTNAVREISLNNKMEYLDLKGVLNIEDIPDGMHPNSNGHKKIFETIKNVEYFSNYKKQ